MKKTEASKAAPQVPVSLDDMAREFAVGLRDAISETDSGYLEREPEEAFEDLAARLIFRLRKTLLLMRTPSHEEEIRLSQLEAAQRILDLLTTWMLANPGCSFDTRRSPTGKFQIVVKTPTTTELFFGESIQDAYAQAAQTIMFNGGSL